MPAMASGDSPLVEERTYDEAHNLHNHSSNLSEFNQTYESVDGTAHHTSTTIHNVFTTKTTMSTTQPQQKLSRENLVSHQAYVDYVDEQSALNHENMGVGGQEDHNSTTSSTDDSNMSVERRKVGPYLYIF